MIWPCCDRKSYVWIFQLSNFDDPSVLSEETDGAGEGIFPELERNTQQHESGTIPHLLWTRHICCCCRGGSRILFRRGCTRLLLYFNTNKPQFFFFCRIPAVLENRSSSGGGGVRTLDPPLCCWRDCARPKAKRHETSTKFKKLVNGKRISIWNVPTGKTGLPFQNFRLSGGIFQ